VCCVCVCACAVLCVCVTNLDPLSVTTDRIKNESIYRRRPKNTPKGVCVRSVCVHTHVVLVYV